MGCRGRPHHGVGDAQRATADAELARAAVAALDCVVQRMPAAPIEVVTFRRRGFHEDEQVLGVEPPARPARCRGGPTTDRSARATVAHNLCSLGYDQRDV